MRHRILFLSLFASLSIAATTISFAPAAHASEAASPDPTTSTSPRSHASMTMGPQKFERDVGFGVSVSTPLFAHDWMRVTGTLGASLHPHGGEPNQDFTPFLFSRVVLEVGHQIADWPVRPYAFGGPTVLYLSNELSSAPVAVGGLGGVGLEISAFSDQPVAPFSMFAEVGGIETTGQADRIPGGGGIADGLFFTFGARIYL